MSPYGRARVTEIALAAAFSALAAWLFLEGDERGGSLPYFLGWVTVHVLFGVTAGSLTALAIAVVGPPLFVVAGGGSWVEALFVELFYGVAFVFAGIVARRVWQGRRAGMRRG